jgi:hypothetical protein
MNIYQQYAHVFWIPLFPVGKTARVHCEQCKKVSEKKEFTQSIKMVYDNLKTEVKTPVWTFAGLAVVFLIISYAFYQSAETDKKIAAYTKAPEEGDIWEMKFNNSRYTLYKVVGANKDSVFIQYHQYETNQSSGLDDLRKKGDGAYSNENYLYLLPELEQMTTAGEIIDIERKN